VKSNESFELGPVQVMEEEEEREPSPEVSNVWRGFFAESGR